MCSYQNSSDVSCGFGGDNWEEEFWAKAFPDHHDALPRVEVQVTESTGNHNDLLTSAGHTIQNSVSIQESSALLSPKWEEQAVESVEIPQSSSDMSNYFASFNPSLAQCDPTPMNYYNPVTQITQTQQKINSNVYNRRIQRAPVIYMRTENGSLKTIVKRKRKRTIFTTEQVEILESVFSKKPYITRQERHVLVDKLQVSDKSVKIWFQNRRLKIKRGDYQSEYIQAENQCTNYDRLDYVESKIIEKTDEFGYVTLDDKIIADLVDVIDHCMSNSNSPMEIKPETFPYYEPISPASVSDYASEDNNTHGQRSSVNGSIQELIDIESIISS